MKMTAKFPGRCSSCSTRFAAGEAIDYDRITKKARCLVCVANTDTDAVEDARLDLAAKSSAADSARREAEESSTRLKRVWSSFQTAIFADVATGTWHTVVRARAGTGKTTTIVEALRHVPAGKSCLMVAFNKKIAEELTSRAPAGVQVKTLHGFGFCALMSVRKVRLDQNRVRAYLSDRNPEWTGERIGALCKAIGLAKGMLAQDAADIDDIIDRFELDVPEHARAEFCRDALETMAWCKRDTGTCDFDDMVWLPVVLGTRVEQFDYVFVDETQDLNKAQIELAMRACKKGGRIIAVGDDRQAIYGFRGADEAAMAGLIERLGARVLPLSVTYRCGKNIVGIAREIVTDYEAAPTNADGLVSHVGDEVMKRDAKAGDFIISRANAPLIGLCLDFLKRGVRANIAGRDVGASLLTLITKSNASTVAELTKYVDEWCALECARLAAKKPPRDSQSVEDRAECINALCEGAASVSEVRARIESLFSDKDDSNRIMLTTTHKAKGLERERCWILTETYRPRRSTEEANLWYVAVTRAKSELYLVGKGSSEPPPSKEPVPAAAEEAPAVDPAPPTEPSPKAEPAPVAMARSEASACPSRWHAYECALNSGHEGMHSTEGGFTRWPDVADTRLTLEHGQVSSEPDNKPALGVVKRRRPVGLMPQGEADAKPARFNGRCGCGKAHSVLADGRQCHRHYGWFWHTPKGAMGEDDRGARLSFWLSCDCGKMARLFKVDGTYNADKKCDGRCMSARGHVCECSCGGRNHGASNG